MYYRAYPPKLSTGTTDDTDLGLPREAAELAPLYISSQLYREDDIQMSTQMRNEFEDGLLKLQQAMAERPAGGSGRVKNTSGWFA